MTTKTLSNHAAVAKAIRLELKRRGIAGRVTAKSYAGGSSVTATVHDIDPALARELETFCTKFEMGKFDSQTDCYEYSNRRDDIPQVKFVFVENRPGELLSKKIWDYCRSYYDVITDPSVSGYIPAIGCYGTDLVWRVFNGSMGNFWKERAA